MKLVFSHPTGNANVRAAAKGLMEAELLAEFQTSIASFPGSFLDSLGSIGPLTEIRRRRFDPVLKPITYTSPLLEMARLLSLKVGFKKLTKHEVGLLSVDAVYKSFDKKVAASLAQLPASRAQGVYAYEDAAEFTFRKAKKLGLKCFYDLPIGYWRAANKLLEAERKRWPDWEATLLGFSDSTKKLNRKDQELLLADTIFVASNFTANTLQNFPGTLAPIKVIPYGFPSVSKSKVFRNLSRTSKLKLLFVGGLSQRKGIADLFAALEEIASYVELTVVGSKVTDHCPALDLALAKHKWIPSLSHSDILKIMEEHDVLVFPSLFEGFGLVITESMSRGTPVITTDRTAGPDVINNNENGWLIDPGNVTELRLAIEKLLCNPTMIAQAGKAARYTAEKRPWEVYGYELAEAINSV